MTAKQTYGQLLDAIAAYGIAQHSAGFNWADGAAAREAAYARVDAARDEVHRLATALANLAEKEA